MSKVNVLGVRVDSLSQIEILEKITQVATAGERLLIAHANLRGLNLAYEKPWLKDFYNQQADLVYCDGMGVQLGALLSGKSIPERFTLADWIWNLAEVASRERISIFLLGNPPGVADKAALKLLERYPTLQIAGVQHGYFHKAVDDHENAAVIEMINTLHPDLLLVGFGMPLQEKWLEENWAILNVQIAITCGALFEYLSGNLHRGPKWMTDHYLEWLARILISPRRYSPRYLRDIPLFLYHILRERFSGE